MSTSQPEPEPVREPDGSSALSSCPGLDALDALDALDVEATLAAAAQAHADRHAAEVLALQVDLHYAVLHSGPPPRPDGPLAGTTRLVRLGGEGTPKVQDLPICELGHRPRPARHLDPPPPRRRRHLANDLAHRLPRLWAHLQAGDGAVWVARRIAAMSRHLTLTAAAAVDTAVTQAVAESPGRLLTIAEAAIIRADPDTTRATDDARRRQRCLIIKQSDEQGLRTVFARIAAGDAAWLDAMIDRIATALTERPDLADPHPDHPNHDTLRVEAFGWLAHPESVIDLLRGTHPSATTEPDPDSDAAPDAEPSPARQRAVVHVHLAADAVSGLLTTHGVARVEELGPMLLTRLRTLLDHARVDLTPVIDLNASRSVNGYEHPADVRDRGLLRTTGDVFPHAQTQTRRCDHDHPVPYDTHGPPGQTGDHNHAPLTRHHHRAKTHLGYRVWQLDLGRYLWRTPHGLWRLVDHTGTHHLDETTARALIRDGQRST